MSGNKDPDIHLYHIRDACKQIIQFIEGYSYDSFCRDPKTQNAVIRLIQVIGEAARQMDEGAKKKLSDVAWEQIIGMRNRVVHEYVDIELELIWDSASTEAPELLEKIKKVLSP